MGKLIDTAVTHFSSKTIRELKVPEWDVTLYAKNLTLDDKAKWYSRADGNTTEYLIYALIFGVTDSKGDAVFDVGDKVKLRTSSDPDVVSRVANWVVSCDSDKEEIEGN
jgi:hypothetical protein|tara:strand:+ start:3355 stop:3681 length:327 start_codon:yes stop_codon:yes gene_type:complete